MGRELMAFNEADVVRAIKAMQAADFDVVRTEIYPDRRIVIVHEKSDIAVEPNDHEIWQAEFDARMASTE